MDTIPTASHLAERLQRGDSDAIGLADAALALIQHTPHAFVGDALPTAPAEASDSDARRRTGSLRGPLDGIPIAWKDLFDIKGRVTTAGSVVLKSDPPANRDAVREDMAGRDDNSARAIAELMRASDAGRSD